MRLVIDASVVVQVAIAGGNLGPLRGHELIAPPVLRSEALSSISELTFRGEIPPDAARETMLRIAAIDIELDRPADMDERAWDLARQLGWAKTYDAEYLVLSIIRDAPLVTLDERLRRGAARLVQAIAPIDLG